MNYYISVFKKLCDGLVSQSLDHPFEYIAVDHRQIAFPKLTLFFALPGSRNDGHNFIQHCKAQGVRNFVISDEKFLDETANYFIPSKTGDKDSVLHALQSLAKYHTQHYDLKIISITGSNGKTTVKEWLHQFLSPHYNVVSNPKSYNSQIGVPLSVFQIRSHHEIGIFEAGISKVGEMEKIAPIINCNIGVFTNIGQAHNEGFENLRQKVKQKARLFENAEKIIYCSDYLLIDEILQQMYDTQKLYSWSFSDLEIIDSTCVLTLGGAELKLYLHSNHKANVENLVHCACVCHLLGVAHHRLESDSKLLQSVDLRLELISGRQGCIIVNDAYNADIDNLKVALAFQDEQKGDLSKTVIISDFLETGLTPEKLNRELADLLANQGLKRLITIGSHSHLIGRYIGTNVKHHHFASTDDSLREIQNIAFDREIILIKGARSFKLEQIALMLTTNTHDAVLEIDLNALTHNFSVFKDQLKPDTKVMGMVKASAYGTGSVEIAKILEMQGVDYLACAYIDEGIELRNEGISIPILILNPDLKKLQLFSTYRLEPQIAHREALERVIAEDATLPIHIKLNTGMNRLGFTEEDIPVLIAKCKKHHLIVNSIFSHLMASDDEEFDKVTHKQMATFRKWTSWLIDEVWPLAKGGHSAQATLKAKSSTPKRPLLHLLNSNGIARFPQYQLDMVRLGIGLYGIVNHTHMSNLLQKVHRLKAKVTQVNKVSRDNFIGYNATSKTDDEKTIATINIGYADGLLRTAGNGEATVLVNNQEVNTIGNICMDVSMLDITDIGHVKIGDVVEIFGTKKSIENLALQLKTIPYEILSKISRRIKRIYFKD